VNQNDHFVSFDHLRVNEKSHTQVLVQIGQKLEDLRRKKGYTSYENFAFDYDLPRVHYWRIEKGKVNVTLKSLIRILAIHNLTMEEFFSMAWEKADNNS
jgi:transcriptional regulator with XRE-family HTH domain